MRKPNPNEIYRHFKGNLYQVVTLAEHTETGEELVVYRALYGTFQVYARPLAMFLGPVDHEKYPEALQQNRFELVEAVTGEPGRQSERQPERQENRRAETTPQEKALQQTETAAQEKALQQTETAMQEKTQQQTEATEQELQLDPLVLEFLDADTYEERLNILAALHHRITDDMINTMAMAVDVEIKEGDVEERYAELKNCLLTFDRYECSRMR